MKINSTAAFHAYNKVVEYSQISRQAESRPEAAAQRSEHTDQIQISPEGARKMEVEQLSRSIIAQMREPASPARLEGLRTAVQNKSYYVPTEDLVNAVMGRLVTA